jgi:chaperonin cofactor prefoldin
MEPGAPLYQRETVYLAADVDSLLQQRKEELAKRMHAWNTLRDGYDESIAQLQHQLAAMTNERDSAEMRSVSHLKMYIEASQQLAAMTGPGTPYARWQKMLEALEQRFPDPQPYESSCPAEARYLEAIDRIIAQLAASEQTAYERAWKIDTLKDQLAASTARCAELEEELKVLAKCGCVDGNGVPFAACQGCHGTGDRRSAPTDRSPA